MSLFLTLKYENVTGDTTNNVFKSVEIVTDDTNILSISVTGETIIITESVTADTNFVQKSVTVETIIIAESVVIFVTNIVDKIVTCVTIIVVAKSVTGDTNMFTLHRDRSKLVVKK